MTTIPGTDKAADLVAASRLRERLGDAPRAVVVLGSGMSPLVDRLDSIEARIPYAELSLASTSVSGHDGALIIGNLGGERICLLSGRVHMYEGTPMEAVVRNVRAMAAWGVERLVLTSATGSVVAANPPGTCVRVLDHINLTGRNPLVGPNRSDLGERFPDMTHAYDHTLGAVADSVAAEQGLPYARGIYCALSGPSYETPAEIRMMQVLGADVVGMSLIPEVIAARHAGMRVLAFAVVSNFAAGLSKEEFASEEVAARWPSRSARGRPGS